MQEIVGESLARRLVEWGVDTVFGLLVAGALAALGGAVRWNTGGR